MAVEVIQLNCHNCRQANVELNIKLEKGTNNVALLQEPYVCGKRILPNDFKNYDVYPRNRAGHPRTSIVAEKNLTSIEITELCDQFMTVAAFQIDNKWILMASIYMHGEREIGTPNLTKMFQVCDENAFQLIISADANAHSELWSPKLNKKCTSREILEE